MPEQYCVFFGCFFSSALFLAWKTQQNSLDFSGTLWNCLNLEEVPHISLHHHVQVHTEHVAYIVTWTHTWLVTCSITMTSQTPSGCHMFYNGLCHVVTPRLSQQYDMCLYRGRPGSMMPHPSIIAFTMLCPLFLFFFFSKWGGQSVIQVVYILERLLLL